MPLRSIVIQAVLHTDSSKFKAFTRSEVAPKVRQVIGAIGDFKVVSMDVQLIDAAPSLIPDAMVDAFEYKKAKICIYQDGETLGMKDKTYYAQTNNEKHMIGRGFTDLQAARDYANEWAEKRSRMRKLVKKRP